MLHHHKDFDLQRRLTRGEDPRNQGGLDALAKLPAPTADAPTATERRYIEEYNKAHDENWGWVTAQFAEHDRRQRLDPRALQIQPPDEIVDGWADDALAACQAELAPETAGVHACGQEAEEAQLRWQRTVQVTGRSRPSGDFPKIAEPIILFIIFLAVEGVLGWVVLRHALGDPMAALQGLVVSLAVQVLGGLAAAFVLAPTQVERKSRRERQGRWIVAGLLGVLAFAIIWFVAAQRAVLIEGGVATAAATWSAMTDLGRTWLHLESLGLAILGVGGFLLSAFEINRVFGGCGFGLRGAYVDLARKRAALETRINTLVGHILARGAAEVEKLNVQGEQNDQQAAHGLALGSEYLRDLMHARAVGHRITETTLAISVDYRVGYREVGGGDTCITPTPLPDRISQLDTDQVLTDRTATVREVAEAWARALRRGKERLRQEFMELAQQVEALSVTRPPAQRALLGGPR